jgi:hypothetical protein
MAEFTKIREEILQYLRNTRSELELDEKVFLQLFNTLKRHPKLAMRYCLPESKSSFQQVFEFPLQMLFTSKSDQETIIKLRNGYLEYLDQEQNIIDLMRTLADMVATVTVKIQTLKDTLNTLKGC